MITLIDIEMDLLMNPPPPPAEEAMEEEAPAETPEG
jgi:hypothetical protein